MRREAAADTRGHKSGHGAGDLRSQWLAEAATVGVTAETLADSINAAAADSRPEVEQSVTVGEVIAAVAEQRSAWHRFDVLQAICDVARPQPAVDGARWAQCSSAVTDSVLAECVDLDPVDTGTRRRGSDGRSVWIEPSARHHTSSEVLAQEEHIICWAMDAQLDPPAPSTTVNTGRLDVMQAEAAAAVAGSGSVGVGGRPGRCRQDHDARRRRRRPHRTRDGWCSVWRRRRRRPVSSNPRPAWDRTRSRSCCTSGDAPIGHPSDRGGCRRGRR